MSAQERAIALMRDTVRTCIVMKLQHSAVAENIRKVVDTMPNRTPRYERAYVLGYGRALLDAIWDQVEFCYRDADGTLYSTHAQSVHRKTEEFYARGDGRLLGDLECAHVWKGTDTPYTPWEVPNNRKP